MKKYRAKPKADGYNGNVRWILQEKFLWMWISRASYHVKDEAIKVMNTLNSGEVYPDKEAANR